MDKNKQELKKWITLILVAIIGYWAINNLNIIGNILGYIFKIIFPFFLGGCLAFILNIPMSFFERKLSRNKKSSKKKGKGLRILSIVFAIVIILLVLTLVIRLIVPELVEVLKVLTNNIPYYIEELTKILENHVADTQQLNNIMQNINIEEIKNQILALIPNALTSSISIVGNIVSGISTFFIAFIFAIYILIDKEKLQRTSNQDALCLFKKRKSR